MLPHIILNPASSAGRTGRQQDKIIDKIDQHLGKKYSLCVTQKPLEARMYAYRAIMDGCKLIIVVGGDGTINEVVNGFFSDGKIINPECSLGIINSSTSGGFVQSIGLPLTIEEQLGIILRGESCMVDLCKINFQNQDRCSAERYYINECQIGIGGIVVRDVQAQHKRFGGRLAFGLITLKSALGHKGTLYNLQTDEDKETELQLHGVVVANGTFMGGGMKLTPKAKLNDGMFDILLIHDQSPLQRIISFSKVYSGKHLASKWFSYNHGRSIKVRSSKSQFVAVDGELIGTLPCQIEIIPRILRVHAKGM
ncbi:MAG: diacylglycerol kinase family lipid kinase [Bacteroidota bacterium]|nr:diacylglycerol kinase family lipid kinase [Bacteroidota bacterium]